MNRNKFIRDIVRAGLFALLGLLVFSLKNRISKGGSCVSCLEIDRCPGKNACIKY